LTIDRPLRAGSEPAIVPVRPQPSGTHKRPDPPLIIAGALCALFVVLGTTALTTLPPYYEDESWTFVSMFEAVRGNGCSYAAFGEGQQMLGVFCGLLTPFVAISPLSPEATVRTIAGGAGLCVLLGAFAIARRHAPGQAWIAPAVILSTPSLFAALRYGRIDVFALALTLWALAAAGWNRPALSGVLSGLAVSVHPMFLWVAAPCLVYAVNDARRTALRYLAGAAIGVAPQVVWTVANWNDVRAVVQRFAVSSSLGAHSSAGLVSSVLAEPHRYRAYLDAVPVWSVPFQLIGYGVLPAVAIWFAVRARRAEILVLTAAPILGLALLVQSKNPYYLYGPLAALAVVATYAAARLRPRVTKGIVALVLAGATVATGHYATDAWNNRGMITAQEATAELAEHLPRGAVVIAPNLYAGLIRRRPDLRFFNYHALSLRPGWALPACEELPSRIRTLVAADGRVSSRGPVPSEVYLVGASETILLAYLQQIYVHATIRDAQCMLSPPGGQVRRVPVCGSRSAPCAEIQISRMRIGS
jgi:hypothetical protein